MKKMKKKVIVKEKTMKKITLEILKIIKDKLVKTPLTNLKILIIIPFCHLISNTKANSLYLGKNLMKTKKVYANRDKINALHI